MVPGEYLSFKAALNFKLEYDTVEFQLQFTTGCNGFLEDGLADDVLDQQMQLSWQQASVMVPDISSLLLRLLWIASVHVS